jgi:hypothetical protein
LWISQYGYNHVYANDGDDSATHDDFNFASLAVQDGPAEHVAHRQAVRDVAVLLGDGSYIYEMNIQFYQIVPASRS